MSTNSSPHPHPRNAPPHVASASSATIDLIGAVLPFAITVDATDRVTWAGASLVQLVPNLVGRPFTDAFTVARPLGGDISTHGARLGLRGRHVRLEIDDVGAQLRGHFVPLNDQLVFAATLVLDSPSQLTDLSLKLSRFAPQDAGPDLIMLLQMRDLNEAHLQAVVAELREVIRANAALSEAEAQLIEDLDVASDVQIRLGTDLAVVEPARIAISTDDGFRQELQGNELKVALEEINAIVKPYIPTLDCSDIVEKRLKLHVRSRVRHFDLRTTKTLDGEVLIVGRDITEDHRRQAEIAHRATHDSLTDLGNRRLFLANLADALNSGPPNNVVVLVTDLNGFKGVNDVYGHAAGDQVLCHVASRINGCVGPNDTVARLGGDEFAVLIPDVDSAHHANELAWSIAHRVGEPMEIGVSRVSVSATIGVAIGTADATVDGMIRDADLAMYNARQEGEQVGWFAKRLRDEVDERRVMTAELLTAIDNREIGVAFQPVVDLKTLQPVGFEALARWHHPDRGPVSPEVFIGLAERSNNIAKLDRLIAEVAIARLVDFSSVDQSRDLSMSINLSPLSLTGELGGQLAGLMRSHGLAPSRLTVEITETSLLADVVHAELSLAAMVEHGISVALDDFGTGYSSLTHLQRLPIAEVKIDRSFVRDVARNERSRRLVDAAIVMARATDALVVAEGIETEAQAHTLRELGCRFGQGFLFARPMSPVDVAAYLATVGSAVEPMTPGSHHRDPPDRHPIQVSRKWV